MTSRWLPPLARRGRLRVVSPGWVDRALEVGHAQVLGKLVAFEKRDLG